MREDVKNELKAAMTRGYFKDIKFIQVLGGDDFDLLWEITDWCVKDNHGDINKASDVLTAALENVDAENMALWLNGVRDALKQGGTKDIIFPNALGFLFQAQQEFKDKLDR
jgi:hypothetical protein